MIELGQVRRLIIAHRDRLVRFGYDYFEAFCQRHHTEMVVMNGERANLRQYAATLGLEIFSVALDKRLPSEVTAIPKALKEAALQKE